MLLNRSFILLLICCVTVREDFSFLVTPVSSVCTSHVPGHSETEEPTDRHEMEAVVWHDESESYDKGFPGQGELPPDDGAIPVVLEDDVDPEAEKMPCEGDHKAHGEFVDNHHVQKNNVLSFSSFNSFCTLIRLRT